MRLVTPSATVTPIRPSLLEALKKLGPETTPAPAAAGELATEAPPAVVSRVPSGWTKIVGPRLASVVLDLTARLAAYTSDKRKKYEPGEVSEDTAEYCADSMAQSLAYWFPETQLTPTKQLFLAFGLAAGEQWIGREEIENSAEEAESASPAVQPIRSPAPVPAAATPAAPPAPDLATPIPQAASVGFGVA